MCCVLYYECLTYECSCILNTWVNGCVKVGLEVSGRTIEIFDVNKLCNEQIERQRFQGNARWNGLAKSQHL